MSDDDAKRRILARRAKFVAAAVAGLGAVSACDHCGSPRPCLEPPLASTTPPGPCLSVSTVPTGVDAGAVIDPDAAPRPHPCLSIIRPTDDSGMPTPCLNLAPPLPSSKP